MKDSVSSAGSVAANHRPDDERITSVTASRPRVSVGVPVYNGDAFLACTLDSLLRQTYSDFEIVICDNGSTDRTREICQEFASRDPRIRYHRSDVNRGATWSNNRVVELARGEYFKWCAADDICAPEFLTRCVAVLDQNPQAIMVMTLPAEIDENGTTLTSVSVQGQTLVPAVPAEAAPHVRFRQTIRLDHLCLTIWSLFRLDVLRATKLLGNYPDADRVLLSHLSLLGPCILIPETLFFNRDHPGRFSRSNGFYDGWRARAVWWDPLNANRKLFPCWKELSEFVRVVRETPLTLSEQVRCNWEILRWVGQDNHLRRLYVDATYYPRKWVVRRFPRAKLAWNWLWNRGQESQEAPASGSRS